MKKKNNIYIILALMLMLNAMVLIGTFGTFESNEQFAPTPEKTESIAHKHSGRIQSKTHEELKQYSTDLVELAKLNDTLLADSFEMQNLLRKIIYIISGVNLIVLAVAMVEIKQHP